MGKADKPQREERVLVLAPTDKDAALSQTILARAGVPCAACPDLAAVCRELAAGAAALVLTEEALAADRADCLAEVLQRQPPWSDLPIILLTGGGADSPAAMRALETLGNVTLLERPVRVTTLVSAVRTALRARRRQYQVREHLVEREQIAQALLQEADRRKDDFLATLAHELRGPLAPLLNSLQIIKLKSHDSALVGRSCAVGERQVQQLAKLVEDLQDVSRIGRGKIRLCKQPLEAGTAIARAVEVARPLLDARNHQLTVLLPPGEPLRLEADPTRLLQVLVNLLTNAAKYTPAGGHVWLSAERDDNDILIRVRDTGVGLPADLLPRVFDLFVQADSGSQGGLGIGLNLVRGLVELHGGSVVAFSDGPGEGSEFVVRLPALVEEPVPKSLVVPETAAVPVRSLRLLVVDDDIDGAESLAQVLRLWRHDVWVAHDGLTALELARQYRPEAVLLDIGLPGGLNGYQVARQLREEGLQGALLVALTGRGQEEDRRQSQAAGCDHHCLKPVDPHALQELLARSAALAGEILPTA